MKLETTSDLKSDASACGFDSRLSHHYLNFRFIRRKREGSSFRIVCNNPVRKPLSQHIFSCTLLNLRLCIFSLKRFSIYCFSILCPCGQIGKVISLKRRSSLSSNLSRGTKHLAFVQWIGHGSSKPRMGVRFPHAGPIT